MSDGLTDTQPGYCRDSELELKKARQEIKRLRDENRTLRDDQYQRFLQWRNIETPCTKCKGTGHVVYGSTAVWRGGVGGCTMTGAVCDSCWGSGDEHKRWADLRKLEARLKAAERQEGMVSDTRLDELSTAYFTPADEGGGYLSLAELNELVQLQRQEIERLRGFLLALGKAEIELDEAPDSDMDAQTANIDKFIDAHIAAYCAIQDESRRLFQKHRAAEAAGGNRK